MSTALDELEADKHCWAIIVTGAGDKAFSAGMDLKAFAAGELGEIMSDPGGFGGITQRDFSKPVIAAVNGAALAGGCEIMLSCDMVVAAEHAVFGIPEVKRGLIAGAGGLMRLPRRLPLAIAMELGLTGEPMDAQRGIPVGPGEPRGPGRGSHRGSPQARRDGHGERPERRALVQAHHEGIAVHPRVRRLEVDCRRRRGDLLVARCPRGSGRVRREAPAAVAAPVVHLMTPVFANLSTAIDGVRLSLHVLAATIWVGGNPPWPASSRR